MTPTVRCQDYEEVLAKETEEEQIRGKLECGMPEGK